MIIFLGLLGVLWFNLRAYRAEKRREKFYEENPYFFGCGFPED